MSSTDKALATQIANIEKKSGKTMADLGEAIASSGLQKHGEIRAFLMERFGVGHGDANVVIHLTNKAQEGGASAQESDVLAEIYAGKKAHQRAIHDRLMADIATFGEFETAPKKGYVSLRRKKQFAMLGPKTNDRFELGINLKDEVSHKTVKAMAPGGMCQYVAALTAPSDVDAALIAIIKRAYDAAG